MCLKNHPCFSRLFFLILWLAIIICPGSYAQSNSIEYPINPETEAIISGVHTLSVHVRDTISHDSVYRFFSDILLLPVYYTPLKYGQRKYAGIYAGNMVLEPCGPYENIDYATDNFRAIFFGINFEVDESLASAELALKRRGIKHQVNQGSIYISDSILCNENIFTALYEVSDKEKRDSLQKTLNITGASKPGIEYIKEINVAYKEELMLLKWKDYLHPLVFVENHVCQINDSLQIHFTQGKINEVKSITIKVKSLGETEQFLAENQVNVSISEKKLKLKESQTFGLSIYLTDKR